MIRQVLDRSGYRRMLLDSSDAEDQERLANIEELITAAKQFAAEDASRTIGDFLENITLASDVDGWDEKQDCVSVMTLHAAKGLEFPVVYMAAVEQGMLPHERSLGRERGGRGGTAAGVRRHDAGQGGTVPVPRPAARVPRPDAVRGAEHVPGRAAEGRRARRSTCRPAPAARRRRIEHWRGGGAAATQGWTDAGVRPRPLADPAATADSGAGGSTPRACWCATRPTARAASSEVSGHGALRKVKIRFPTAGERTFIADKVTLEILRKG